MAGDGAAAAAAGRGAGAAGGAGGAAAARGPAAAAALRQAEGHREQAGGPGGLCPQRRYVISEQSAKSPDFRRMQSLEVLSCSSNCFLGRLLITKSPMDTLEGLMLSASLPWIMLDAGYHSEACFEQQCACSCIKHLFGVLFMRYALYLGCRGGQCQ